MYASKKEAQAALNKARDKAQKAHVAWGKALDTPWDEEAARKYYNRCTDELEEAVNEYARWDSMEDNVAE